MTDPIAPLDERDWLTVVQAASMLNVSEKTIRLAIADGSIPVWRLGPRTIRIPRAALEARARDLASRRN